MYKRLNITLPEDLVATADQFAERERYSRSGLIAAALRSFLATPPEPDGLVVAEARTAYAPAPARTTLPAGHVTPAGAQVDSDIEDVAALLRAFFSARDDVNAAWVFGSVARGEARPGSDVDVAVLLPESFDRDARWDVRLDLSARLPVALLGRRVDVLVLPDGTPLLRHRALVHGIRVWGLESHEAAEAEIRAAVEYWDTRKMCALKDARLGERLRGHGSGR